MRDQPGVPDVCRWVLLGEYIRPAQGEPPTTRSAGNLVGGEVNRKEAVSPVGSGDH